MESALPLAAASLASLVISFGGYWALRTDRRLEHLEAEEQKAGERLARLETMADNIDRKLDYIVEKMDNG